MFDWIDFPSTLYVYRPLHWETSEALIKWAEEQGFESVLPEWDMHVTLIYSKSPFYWNEAKPDREHLLIEGGDRSVEVFGQEDKVIVLTIESQLLTERHDELIAMGASSDFNNYRAHITISYKGEGVDVSQIMPYTGPIRLSSEVWEPITENPYGKVAGMDFNTEAQVVKVNKSLGLVFGYAIICKSNGEDYFDLHGDHIPEDAMLKASVDFMKDYRVSGDMHSRTEKGEVVADGQVVFAFPMTEDIAESLEITTKHTGLLIAIQPSPAVLKKFEDGEYKGFSIGGRRIKEEVIEE